MAGGRASQVRRLTTKGVDKLVRYWLGEQGFKPLLEKPATGDSLMEYA